MELYHLSLVKVVVQFIERELACFDYSVVHQTMFQTFAHHCMFTCSGISLETGCMYWIVH